MTEKEFHKLLIEMIKHGNHSSKNRIVELLSRSSLSFDKTSQFTYRKWNHYQEFIYIIAAPQDMMELINYKDYIEKIIEQIYPVGDDYEYELFGVDIKPGSVRNGEVTSQEVYFEDIQQEIIEELEKAKYTIWVAMAWFTNITLYNILLKKKSQGVNVQIVIDDNETNRNVSFCLENEFETYRVSIKSLYKNIMHDKFCIIDLQTVIHGTFNWTNAANYNKETISIDNNVTTARSFADEFIKLKTRKYG